jgi:hypothetical protein
VVLLALGLCSFKPVSRPLDAARLGEALPVKHRSAHNNATIVATEPAGTGFAGQRTCITGSVPATKMIHPLLVFLDHLLRLHGLLRWAPPTAAAFWNIPVTV